MARGHTKHDRALAYLGSDTGGEVVTAASLNSTQYTGWIYVGNMSQLVIAVDYTHDSGSAVTMSARVAMDNTGADGTGFLLHRVDAAGTSTPYQWSNAVAGSEKWTWTIFNLPLPWINLEFDGTGAGVDDVATVAVLGVTP